MEDTTGFDAVAMEAAADAASEVADNENVGTYGYGGGIVDHHEVTNWDDTTRAAIAAYLKASGGRIVYPEVATRCCGCRCGRCAEGHETGQDNHTERCHREAAASPLEDGRVPLDRPDWHLCGCPALRFRQNPSTTPPRNWSSDCDVHGTSSVWWLHPAQVEAREAADQRLRAIQEAARRARGGEIILTCGTCGERTRPRGSDCLICGSARQEP